MTRNTKHGDLITKRREIVARMRLRGASQREIAAALAKPGPEQMLNPGTGEPFDLAQINRDLAAVRRVWRKNAQADTEQERAAFLAELAEGKRLAWREEDTAALARFMKLEADVRGLNAPTRLEHSVAEGGSIEVTFVDYRDGLAGPAAGPVPDRDPSGPD